MNVLKRIIDLSNYLEGKHEYMNLCSLKQNDFIYGEWYMTVHLPLMRHDNV